MNCVLDYAILQQSNIKIVIYASDTVVSCKSDFIIIELSTLETFSDTNIHSCSICCSPNKGTITVTSKCRLWINVELKPIKSNRIDRANAVIFDCLFFHCYYCSSCNDNNLEEEREREKKTVLNIINSNVYVYTTLYSKIHVFNSCWLAVYFNGWYHNKNSKMIECTYFQFYFTRFVQKF